MIFVGTQEIRDHQIKGWFRKYTYYCNGHEYYIYCKSKFDFLKLINTWNLASGRMNSKYCYSYKDDFGTAINLEDIPMDNKFKVKCQIQCSYSGVQYIQ